MNIVIKKIHDDVETPVYATPQSACFDIKAYIKFNETKMLYYPPGISSHIFPTIHGGDNGKNYHITLHPGDRITIPTGLIFDIPSNYSLRLHPRSGLSLKHGIGLANSEGIIDSDYTDELMVILHNMSTSQIYDIYHGDRIAQAEIVEVNQITFTEQKEDIQQKTSRIGGFGSTGK